MHIATNQSRFWPGSLDACEVARFVLDMFFTYPVTFPFFHSNPEFWVLSASYKLLEVYFGRFLKFRCMCLSKWLRT